MIDTAVVDVDGTLVDSNYHHALAWFRAFRAHHITLPIWRLHRAIGMGGDQLVGAVAGEEVEHRLGDRLRDRWAAEFAPLLDEVAPCDGAHELLADLRARQVTVVLASSGKPEHVDHYLELVEAKSIVDAWTTSEDVERTKPAPDLLRVAMERSSGSAPVVIGDSVWDIAAAKRAGYPSYGLCTGGFAASELREAGAVAVYESLRELCAALDEILAEPSGSSRRP
ncbi:MAG TPA: HAD family hydrolase [Pseudonocardia sp.]|uniref:HAD family hydrolase n=1 Tax=Pseudonocardia sp. TaxID=60912 RepID=UPI002ED97209